jgi:hypothetical protein
MLKGKEGGKYISRKQVAGKDGKQKWVYDYGNKGKPKAKTEQAKESKPKADNKSMNTKQTVISNATKIIAPLLKEIAQNHSEKNMDAFRKKVAASKPKLIEAGLKEPDANSLINYYSEQDIPPANSDFNKIVSSDIDFHMDEDYSDDSKKDSDFKYKPTESNSYNHDVNGELNKLYGRKPTDNLIKDFFDKKNIRNDEEMAIHNALNEGLKNKVSPSELAKKIKPLLEKLEE